MEPIFGRCPGDDLFLYPLGTIGKLAGDRSVPYVPSDGLLCVKFARAAGANSDAHLSRSVRKSCPIGQRTLSFLKSRDDSTIQK